MRRRYELRKELERSINSLSRDSDGQRTTENLYSSILAACQILKDIYFDPELYTKSPEIKEYHVYLRLVHAVEFLNALECLLRGCSMKDAVGMALLWRWDRRCIPPEEEIFRMEDLYDS